MYFPHTFPILSNCLTATTPSMASTRQSREATHNVKAHTVKKKKKKRL